MIRTIAHEGRVLVELRRLGEPTALAEKFLGRLEAQFAEWQVHLDNLMRDAAHQNNRLPSI